MPRGSPTYGFNCGVIAKANNKTVGNVQHHLQFNFLEKRHTWLHGIMV